MTKKTETQKARKVGIRKHTLRDLEVRPPQASDVKGGGFTQVSCTTTTGTSRSY